MFSTLTRMGRLAVIAGALSATCAVQAGTITAVPVTLASLLGTTDSLVGSNLTFSFISSAGSLSASNIYISSFIGAGPEAGENGIEIQADWQNMPTAESNSIVFTVTAPVGVVLTDDYLATSGFVFGGDWDVNENVAGVTGASLLNFDHVTNTNAAYSDTGFYAGQQSITVNKIISLTGTGIAFISDIDQGFSETFFTPPFAPLPASFFGGTALLGLLAIAKGRSRKNSA